MTDDTTITDIIDAQLKSQGVSCIRVTDGHVFTFTVDALEQMLEKARAMGKVVVFVQHGVMQ